MGHAITLSHLMIYWTDEGSCLPVENGDGAVGDRLEGDALHSRCIGIHHDLPKRQEAPEHLLIQPSPVSLLGGCYYSCPLPPPDLAAPVEVVQIRMAQPFEEVDLEDAT